MLHCSRASRRREFDCRPARYTLSFSHVPSRRVAPSFNHVLLRWETCSAVLRNAPLVCHAEPRCRHRQSLRQGRRWKLAMQAARDCCTPPASGGLIIQNSDAAEMARKITAPGDECRKTDPGNSAQQAKRTRNRWPISADRAPQSECRTAGTKTEPQRLSQSHERLSQSHSSTSRDWSREGRRGGPASCDGRQVIEPTSAAPAVAKEGRSGGCGVYLGRSCVDS